MSDAQNFDQLLDINIMDLADKPEFPSLPTGSYMFTFRSAETKSVSGIPFVELVFTFDSAVEVPGGEEVTLEAGSEIKFGFGLTDKDGQAKEFAQGNLKDCLRPFAETFGAITIRDVNEKGANAVVQATVKTTPGKTDPTKKFSNLQSLTIAG